MTARTFLSIDTLSSKLPPYLLMPSKKNNNKKKKRSLAATARHTARNLDDETVKEVEEAIDLDDVAAIAMTKALDRLGISPQSFIMREFYSKAFHMVSAVVPVESVPSHLALHKKVLYSMTEDMQEDMECVTTVGHDSLFETHASNMQKSFDKRIQQHEKEIAAKCYNGSVAALHEKCPAYKTTSAKVWMEFMQSCDKRDETIQNIYAEARKIEKDFRNLYFGLHRSKWVCWNCGAKATVSENSG